MNILFLDVKMRQLKGNEVIVKPEWITACLEAEKLVDYKSYLLFTNKSKANKITNFTSSTATSTSRNESKVEVKDEKSPSKESIVSPFKAKDAKDPKFLGEFFQNSRLHHISTMGANAKVVSNSYDYLLHDIFLPNNFTFMHILYPYVIFASII